MSACCTDYEPPEFYKERWIVARKTHICCECKAEIQKGEMYQYITGKWDGMLETFKTCEKCAGLRESLNDVWCVALGELKFEYREYLDNIGVAKYDEDADRYIYPKNHLNLNGV